MTTPLEEVLYYRRGVCQDFAHLAIGCFRSMGLAARYVSGYLETTAPEGEQQLIGADASHAWPSVYVPEWGWLDVDPTNDKLVGTSYVTTAWGRDYSDVTPLKGIVFGGGDSTSSTSRSTDPPPLGPSRHLDPSTSKPVIEPSRESRAIERLATLGEMRILITGSARAIGAATAEEPTRPATR